MSRIAYIQYTNPAAYPPLEHSSRILADAGWQVLFLGVAMENTEALQFPPHANIVVRQLPICHPGWRQKLHYMGYVLWAALQTLVSRSSWVYASDRLACPPGLLLSYVPGIRVLYHEHDSPSPARDGNNGGSRFMRFVLWTRHRLGRRAAFCILPNERRAERFGQDIGDGAKVECVWNCPRKNEVRGTRAAMDGEYFWVVYHGSLVPARLPATVIEALSLLPRHVRLRVIGYETTGHRGYTGQLGRLADKLGVASQVEFVGAVPRRSDSLDHCRVGDVGLAFMPRNSDDINEQAMTGASNKPFDYLACGLALLVSDLPEWRKLYVENGYAVAVDPDDAHSIAEALNWLRTHPVEVRAMGERGRQRILADWNYETQFAPVIKHLRESQRKR